YDHSYRCDDCKEDFCYDHSYRCHECRRYFCDQDSIRCSECNTDVCKTCEHGCFKSKRQRTKSPQRKALGAFQTSTSQLLPEEQSTKIPCSSSSKSSDDEDDDRGEEEKKAPKPEKTTYQLARCHSCYRCGGACEEQNVVTFSETKESN